MAIIVATAIEKRAKAETNNENEEHNRKQPRARLQNDTSANIYALFAGSHYTWLIFLSTFFYSCNCILRITHTHTQIYD